MPLFPAPFSSLFFFPFFTVKSLSFLSIQWFISFTSSTQNITETDYLEHIFSGRFEDFHLELLHDNMCLSPGNLVTELTS